MDRNNKYMSPKCEEMVIECDILMASFGGSTEGLGMDFGGGTEGLDDTSQFEKIVNDGEYSAHLQSSV